MHFKFGRNWSSFAKQALSEQQIVQAREFFYRLISPEQLKGKRFIDIGFGQGLSLCLASEAGANAVGLDRDRDNLEALQVVQSHFGLETKPDVKIGSVLDSQVIEQLLESGPFDVVHSWGVLHHTGQMWKAIDNCTKLVARDGILVIAIYQTHWSSTLWKLIKYTYNVVPEFLQKILVLLLCPIIAIAKFIVTKQNPFDKERGMEFFHDVVDWVGGYPYEFATVEEIRAYFIERGFEEEKFFAAQVPTGCNEFVFRKK